MKVSEKKTKGLLIKKQVSEKQKVIISNNLDLKGSKLSFCGLANNIGNIFLIRNLRGKTGKDSWVQVMATHVGSA